MGYGQPGLGFHDREQFLEREVTVRFTKLLTNGFRSSFEILAVRYELRNFIT